MTGGASRVDSRCRPGCRGYRGGQTYYRRQRELGRIDGIRNTERTTYLSTVITLVGRCKRLRGCVLR